MVLGTMLSRVSKEGCLAPAKGAQVGSKEAVVGGGQAGGICTVRGHQDARQPNLRNGGALAAF